MSFAKIELRAKQTLVIPTGQILTIQADEWQPEHGFFVVRNARFAASARPTPEHLQQMQREVFHARVFGAHCQN